MKQLTLAYIHQSLHGGRLNVKGPHDRLPLRPPSRQ